jgi:putative heme transporter
VSVESTPDAVPGSRHEREAARRTQRSRIVRGVVVAVLVVGGGAAVVVFRARIAEWWGELVGVSWRWVLLAAVVQLVSMHCLVLQLRVLLRAGRGRGSLRSLAGTLYAGNAISIGVPVAGAAASAAYTFRRVRGLGNSAALVSWALAVSGISSTVTLAAVLAVGAAATGSAVGAVGAFLASAAAVVPVVVAILTVRHQATRAALVRMLQRGARLLGRWVSALRGPDVETRIGDLLTSLGSFRLGAAATVATGALSLANWVLDAACLGLAVVAVGADVPWQGLLLVWGAGAVVSSARLTPGGIGVVEAALASALVAAGLPASQAVPAVVVYRLVSLWLLAGIGSLCLLTAPPAREHGAPTESEPAAG